MSLGSLTPSDPLVTNPDPRLDTSVLDVIHGTDGRDEIRGTTGDDYIIAGAGRDFYVLGGGGADTFEVNFGDEIVRIADFTLGMDLIALENPDVLATATIYESNGRLDIRLSDGTLIRIDGLTLAGAERAFIFRNIPKSRLPDPTDPAPPADPLVANTDARLDTNAMNVIEGTAAPDDIAGTDGADYIIHNLCFCPGDNWEQRTTVSGYSASDRPHGCLLAWRPGYLREPEEQLQAAAPLRSSNTFRRMFDTLSDEPDIEYTMINPCGGSSNAG